jgi:hypothetical protein
MDGALMGVGHFKKKIMNHLQPRGQFLELQKSQKLKNKIKKIKFAKFHIKFQYVSKNIYMYFYRKIG